MCNVLCILHWKKKQNMETHKIYPISLYGPFLFLFSFLFFLWSHLMVGLQWFYLKRKHIVCCFWIAKLRDTCEGKTGNINMVWHFLYLRGNNECCYSVVSYFCLPFYFVGKTWFQFIPPSPFCMCENEGCFSSQLLFHLWLYVCAKFNSNTTNPTCVL